MPSRLIIDRHDPHATRWTETPASSLAGAELRLTDHELPAGRADQRVDRLLALR